MPRLGQLLSALVIALIGVLVVQMVLIAGMHERLAADQRAPTSGTLALPAPAADPALVATMSTDAPPAPPSATLVIIISARPPALGHSPGQGTMLDLPAPPANPPPSDDGKALIERFIDLTSKPLGAAPSTQEVAP
jgi:hypothetical protein